MAHVGSYPQKKEEGYRLSDVYGSYSTEKEKAYNDCFSKYVSAEKSKNFHIFSYNTFGFSVTWEETIENEEYLHIETPKSTKKENELWQIFTIWMELKQH